MYRDMENGESAPGRSLKTVASSIVADSYLVHSTPEDRDRFRGELAKAMDEEDERALLVLAGLREAGLGFKNMDGKISLSMRYPRLSNPDPAEFSSQVSAAISDPKDAIEILAKRGQETFSRAEERSEMDQWLENMEIAIQDS